MMSYRAWQQHYALDPSAIGSTFIINQQPFIIAGIAPPGFFGDTLRSDPPDFWLPLATEPIIHRESPLLNLTTNWLYVIGRLNPGAQPSRVQSEITLELEQWLGNQTKSHCPGSRQFGGATRRVRTRRKWGREFAGPVSSWPAVARDHWRAGAVNRLRQYRQFDAGSRHRCPFRDRDSHRIGCASPPPDSAGPYGKRSTGE